MRIAFMFLLLCASANAQWEQDFVVWWPETVSVRFDGQWTPMQKRTALRCLDGALMSQTLKPMTAGRNLLWYGQIESDGVRYARVEKPSEIVEATGKAHIVLRQDASIPRLSTETAPAAGLPVIARIRPECFRSLTALMDQMDHIAAHWGGATHDD